MPLLELQRYIDYTYLQNKKEKCVLSGGDIDIGTLSVL